MSAAPALRFRHRHLLGIQGLSQDEIVALLDLSETYVAFNRSAEKKRELLAGRTLINLFFENSTRTRTSFELAGKRLGGDVINMQAATSSIKKGETLIDTAMTLNAMHPDVLVVRHPDSGAVNLLSQKVSCAVINGGDGSHEHPTQALLDALTIRRRRGRLQGLLVAICGDILHSRVARSNIHLLTTMGARVRVIAPPTLLPSAIDRLGVVVQNLAGAGHGRMTDAIAAYQRALRTFDRERYPQEFAILQNNLATAFLSIRFADERSKMCEALAVLAFEQGLKVVNLIDHPSEYAMLQNNLGNALQYASSSHSVENSLRALDAYDEALKVRRRETTPLEYANTIANKANCLANLPDELEHPERGNFANLAQAKSCYLQAQEIFMTHGEPDRARIVAEAVMQIEREILTLPTPNEISARTKVH